MKALKIAVFAALSVLLSSACSDSNSTGSIERKVTGTALSVVDGSPQPNRGFVVLDLSKTGDDQKIAEGTSDASGSFLFKILGDARNLIVAFGPVESEPRTSGLVSLLETAEVSKDLDNATDIACQAGAQALGDGSLVSTDLNAARIANLEAGAQQVLDSQSVDFSDSASVQNAVDQVRASTNDGAQAPSS